MLSSSPTSFTHPFLSTSPPLSPISPPSRSPRLPPPLVSASCSYTCTEDPPRLHQIPRRTTPANASLYEILEVPRGATGQDIKSAYRRLARICHPDVAAVVLTGATSTARFFLEQRPALDLHAETGGKNALIVSPLADRELAIRDLVGEIVRLQGNGDYAGTKAFLDKWAVIDPEAQQVIDSMAHIPVDIRPIYPSRI